MKRFFIIAIAVVAVAASCTKENAGIKENGQFARFTFTGISDAGNDAIQSETTETKITVGEIISNKKRAMLWEEADAIGVFTTTSGAVASNAKATLTSEGGSAKGTFSTTGVKPAESGSTDLFIYYPYNSAATFQNNAVQIEIPAVQDFDLEGFAWGKATVGEGETTASFTLGHPLCYVQLTISGATNYSDCKVKEIRFRDRMVYNNVNNSNALETKDAKPLCGTHSMNLSDGTITSVTPGYKVTLRPAQMKEIGSTGTVAYMTIAPANLYNGAAVLEIDVYDPEQDITFTVTKYAYMDFNSAHLCKLTIDLDQLPMGAVADNLAPGRAYYPVVCGVDVAAYDLAFPFDATWNDIFDPQGTLAKRPTAPVTAPVNPCPDGWNAPTADQIESLKDSENISQPKKGSTTPGYDSDWAYWNLDGGKRSYIDIFGGVYYYSVTRIFSCQSNPSNDNLSYRFYTTYNSNGLTAASSGVSRTQVLGSGNYRYVVRCVRNGE